MKYLFINVTAGYGSTGKIAADQCRALTEQGHRCVLAFGRAGGQTDVETVRIGSDLGVRAHALQARLLDNVGFGSREATRRFLKWVEAYDPDVIWLHNIHGYYIHIGLLFDYLRGCGKELHWTIHDCWPFTGHCTYFEDARCDRWKTGCHDCPQKSTYPESWLADNSARNYREKKRLFTRIPNLTLHVPSHWLEERVKKSFLGGYPVTVEYNRVDRQIFHPVSGDFRKKYGLEGKKILLGVASVWEERKGLKDFIALSQMLPEDCRIVLIGLTPRQKERIPERILGLSRFSSPQALAEAYSAADIFINPSTEETFGMTTLEARCCGTPVIVYQGTACEEIAAAFGGLAVPKGAEYLYEGIMTLLGKETQ